MPGPQESAQAAATTPTPPPPPPAPQPPVAEPSAEPVAEPPAAAPLPVRPVRRFPASGEMVGPFTLGEVLGHGGFAHVYRATGPDGDEVALKVLTGLQDGARDRFEQEVRLLEKVGGRGFPELVQAGLDEPQPWFAMELVRGSTLRDHVRAEGPLDAHRALRLADQLASALLVLQEQRCVHRDLKPANIMVDGDRAVLIDLGIAKMFDAATSTQPVGTLAYMAPEMFARHVHPRSDVYSLGLILIFASTGSLPPDLNFLGRDLEPEDLVEEASDGSVPDIDKHLRGLILSMTRYQPNHRPALENVSRVIQARIAGEAADETALLTQRVLDDGVTAAERALGPVAELASTVGLPVRAAEARTAAEARAREPWHALVYDAALMSVLFEVHGDGFDGAAEQVIAEHVAGIGAEVADGRTPAEIKDWIWHAMRWQPSAPPDGHADTLRGWRAYRNPERSAPAQVAPTEAAPAPPRDRSAMRQTQVLPASEVAATRVGPPVPPSVRPRTSPVKHLGPAPRPPSVRPGGNGAVGATRLQAPVPAAAPRAAIRPQVAPAPPAAPASAPRAAVRTTPGPGPWLRAGGALLRMVPRLLLLAAVLRTVLLAPVGVYQRTEPFFGFSYELVGVLKLPFGLAGAVEGPTLALAALVVAVVLRAAGHRMLVGPYVLGVIGTSAYAVTTVV